MSRLIVLTSMTSSAEIRCTYREVTQDIVDGLDGVMFNGLMENIEWFFNLHDKDKDGSLTKDELLKVSESLLVRANLIKLVKFLMMKRSSSSGTKWAMLI